MQREEEHDGGAEEDGVADEVEGEDAFEEGELGYGAAALAFEEEEDGQEGDAADGEVDVEA